MHDSRDVVGRCQSSRNTNWSYGVTRLDRNLSVVNSSPIKGSRCFLDLHTLPLLLSNGWFEELI